MKWLNFYSDQSVLIESCFNSMCFKSVRKWINSIFRFSLMIGFEWELHFTSFIAECGKKNPIWPAVSYTCFDITNITYDADHLRTCNFSQSFKELKFQPVHVDWNHVLWWFDQSQRCMMSMFFIIKKVEHVTLIKMIAFDVKPLKNSSN